MYPTIVDSSLTWSDILLLITLLVTGFYGGRRKSGYIENVKHLIQSWNIHQLPKDVQLVKHQIANDFWGRSICMTGCFALNLLAF